MSADKASTQLSINLHGQVTTAKTVWAQGITSSRHHYGKPWELKILTHDRVREYRDFVRMQ